jgi:hypothetical protein
VPEPTFSDPANTAIRPSLMYARDVLRRGTINESVNESTAARCGILGLVPMRMRFHQGGAARVYPCGALTAPPKR